MVDVCIGLSSLKDPRRPSLKIALKIDFLIATSTPTAFVSHIHPFSFGLMEPTTQQKGAARRLSGFMVISDNCNSSVYFHPVQVRFVYYTSSALTILYEASAA